MDFRDDLYPCLSAIDEQIPGVGMQYAHWEGATPRFPFAKAFDPVVRPLSYVPYHLAAPMTHSVMAREVVNDAGAHVEQCVKKLTGRNRRQSLGQVHQQPASRETPRYRACSGDHAVHTFVEWLPNMTMKVADRNLSSPSTMPYATTLPLDH